jgi:hypothetical protein
MGRPARARGRRDAKPILCRNSKQKQRKEEHMKTQGIGNIVPAGALIVALLGLSLPTAHCADQQVSAPLTMPVRVNGTVSMSDCDNARGPQVTLNANLVLGGLNVQGIFRNNVKGTHTHIEEYVTNAVLIQEGGSITLPKQPVLGGVGGNPFIWIQLLDGQRRALTPEIYLGRCVQGLGSIDPSLYMNVVATANASVDCANSPGPFITIRGGLTLSGLNARFIFRNNDNPVGGPHQATRTADVTLIPAGTIIRFPKQPVLGGVGGNPWMWIQFLDGAGDPASDELFIGRCVQSSR